MKVVIAPDKFAGTLSAAEAAAAMRRGWTEVRPGDEIVVVPMADGGEGTLDVVAAAVPDSELRHAEVADALGRAVAARWLLLPDGRALVEAAQACGLSRLAADERNPRLATSYGVGQLVKAGAVAGATEVAVGLGGTATVDGGTGLAIALGHRLLRADGNGLKVGGEFGRDLDRVEAAEPLGVSVVAAVDVTNPLLGPDGAAAVFGPQKGAAPEDVAVLEEALRTVADVVERDLPGGPWRELPGAGAAGGLGFALAAFCGARLAGGAEAVAGLCGLGPALEDAAIVLTGEGKLDAQTAAGKVPAYVVARARDVGARVLAVAGQLADGAGQAFDRAVALGPEGMSRAADLVTERTAELAKEVS
jgi:glycerate 2-kinase